MLRHIRIVLLGILAVFALVLPAVTQKSGQQIDTYATAAFPTLSGRLVDAAGVLDPANRKALVARLEALEAATGDQLVVATVASLHGSPIESYANRLFNIWKLGRKDNNNGVLLLVAPSERKVRIEVGYGLEGTLTDAVAKLIIEQSMVPHFRANDLVGGITQATDDIVQVLTGDAAQWQRRAAANASRDERALARGQVFMYGMFAVAAAAATFGVYVLVWWFVRFLIFLHLLPQRNHRNGFWQSLDKVDADLYDEHGRRIPSHSEASRASDSSGASASSSSSFSGGGGSSGGGGASGSW
jgi:uncharacterized protein